MDFVPVELDVDRYHNKGIKYLNGKKYEKAVRMFQKEIDCIPEDCLGYWYLAKALGAMGKVEEARRNYNIAIRNAEEMRRQGPDMINREMIDEIRKDFDSLGGK